MTAPEMSSIRVSKFNQRRPGSMTWRTWRKFLLTISDKNGILREPLREWTTEHSALRHWPKFVYDHRNEQLYAHSSDYLYPPHHKLASGIFELHPGGPAQPVRGFPSATYQVNGTIRVLQNFRVKPMIQNPRDIPYPAYLQCLQPWEQDLLQRCELLSNSDVMINHIIQGNVEICSDGS